MATSPPLMQTNMELQIPITLINPNLDEIQSYFAQIINNILETHKAIVMWGQRDERRKLKGALKKQSAMGEFRHLMVARIYFGFERRSSCFYKRIQELLQNCVRAQRNHPSFYGTARSYVFVEARRNQSVTGIVFIPYTKLFVNCFSISELLVLFIPVGREQRDYCARILPERTPNC